MVETTEKNKTEGKKKKFSRTTLWLCPAAVVTAVVFGGLAFSGNAEETPNAKTASVQQAVQADAWRAAFEKKVADYDKPTQEAMRMAMDYFQTYQRVVAARGNNDAAAEADAKMDLRLLESGMKDLDINVWKVADAVIGPTLVSQGRKDAKSLFNMEKISKLLFVCYDEKDFEGVNVQTVVQEQAAQTQARVQPQAQGQNVPVEQALQITLPYNSAPVERRVAQLPANYQKAVKDAQKMLNTMNSFFMEHMLDRTNPVLNSLAKEMDIIGARIGQSSPAMQAAVGLETRAVWQKFKAQGGYSETLDIDGLYEKIVGYAEVFSKNPAKAQSFVDAFNAKINAEQAAQRAAAAAKKAQTR